MDFNITYFIFLDGKKERIQPRACAIKHFWREVSWEILKIASSNEAQARASRRFIIEYMLLDIITLKICTFKFDKTY